MALDGIWAVEIYGLYGWESTGILIIEGKRALGGGNNHVSIGTCELTADGQVKFTLSVQYHGRVRTLFGESRENFSVAFAGKENNLMIEGTLMRPDRPEMAITCRLSKFAGVPAIPA